ncbi:aminodeoxychorismate lyase [Nitrincola sp. MINF-07-Sa-05]|uniref:aminodeoxychorismate lyase n=1 Tax=Nitrincola salilacus TaxID=3400273 RepID=UPI0039183697
MADLTTWLNGVPNESITISDRGLSYGHGVFETILLKEGGLTLWPLHLQRLMLGCVRLGIPTEGLESALESDLLSLPSDHSGIVKLIITCGPGGRGYATPDNPQVSRIIQLSPLPDYAEHPAQNGIAVCHCSTRLAIQPLLAGIKHLNRLEQVLARAEWQGSIYREGIVCSMEGELIEATMSNLFFVRNGELCTPDLSRCGVAGVMRARILQIAQQNRMTVNVGRYWPRVLDDAEEVFICNSLIGIWPVTSVEGREYPLGTVTRRLQNELEKSAF